MIVRRIAALTIAGLALASCSSTEPGTATPAASMPDGGQEVPSVPDPLDATPFLDAPCSLVPGDEPNQLHYSNPKPLLPESNGSAKISGPGCAWFADAKGGTLGVYIQTENAKKGMGGIQGIYKGYETKQFSYLEPTEVTATPQRSPTVQTYGNRGRRRCVSGSPTT